jgi:serine/threonine-protein kinase
MSAYYDVLIGLAKEDFEAVLRVVPREHVPERTRSDAAAAVVLQVEQNAALKKAVDAVLRRVAIKKDELLRVVGAGSPLPDRYRDPVVIGKGAFGTVYRCIDEEYGKPVAVKLLHAHLAVLGSAEKRFQQERTLLRGLQHPRVIRTYDVGRHERRPYLVMDLHRESLADVLRRGPLSEADALARVLEVLDGLEHLHAKDVVHRDVRPQNILLDADGRAVLCDLSLARVIGEESVRSATHAAGSLGFMAPEQHEPGDVDARVDVYGAAATLWSLLTGRLQPPLLFLRRWELEGLTVSAVLKRATEAERDDRFANVVELRQALTGPAEPEPGERRVLDCFGVPLEVVWHPAGRFWMGASRQPGRNQDDEAEEAEGPVREVTLTRGFWLGVHPVTVAQYRAFLARCGGDPPGSFRDSNLNGPDQPVSEVDWSDAGRFAASWSPDGLVASLPTEAEWEYAARGGDEQRRYPWGSERPDPTRAWWIAARGGPDKWWSDLTEEERRAVLLLWPAAVGGRPRGWSRWGAEDLAGNVWEWCQDGWSERHPVDNVVDPCHHGDTGSPRVVRGGSWFDPSRFLRASSRLRNGPERRGSVLGFRVVLRPGSFDR